MCIVVPAIRDTRNATQEMLPSKRETLLAIKSTIYIAKFGYEYDGYVFWTLGIACLTILPFPDCYYSYYYYYYVEVVCIFREKKLFSKKDIYWMNTKFRSEPSFFIFL